MANVRLRWRNSTPGAGQRAIARTVIDARVSDQLPWANIALVDAPTAELLVSDLAPGTWFFRATEVDSGNVAATSQPTVSIDLPFDVPAGVTEFTATIE